MTTTVCKNSISIIKLIVCLLLCYSHYVYSQGGMAINASGNPADSSAMLDVSSTAMGLLMPRMTTAERDLIVKPANGLMIINISTNCIEVFFQPVWQSVFCGCNPPAAPVAEICIPSSDQIIWNWNSVAGTSGYKYNTANDYSSAIDNGNDTTYIQTGLICNTAYSLYVWSYGVCGNSTATLLSQVTTVCPFICGVSNISFNYGGTGAPSVTMGTVTGQNNTCWLDRNLGADMIATSYNHADAYGDLFQWGRLDDGHQIRTSLSTVALSNTDVPGHSNFIYNTQDWRSPSNDNLWQGVSGVNNPCPSGWRVPTQTELNNEITAWISFDCYGAYASSLKLPSAGHRGHTGGVIFEGSYGYYWTSTIDISPNARNLEYDCASAGMTGNWRVDGKSIRCIKD